MRRFSKSGDNPRTRYNRKVRWLLHFYSVEPGQPMQLFLRRKSRKKEAEECFDHYFSGILHGYDLKNVRKLWVKRDMWCKPIVSTLRHTWMHIGNDCIFHHQRWTSLKVSTIWWCHQKRRRIPSHVSHMVTQKVTCRILLCMPSRNLPLTKWTNMKLARTKKIQQKQQFTFADF